ncbi:hypothetical protein IW146_006364 [Coemansia sp. RSA 922]|nr:hypothetical protein H4S03_007649 [Coemansia sp. S3946]KAJ2071624.1 hypothetical protein GGH13_003230 [Coemansia sp. S155-1]KAJ2109439.1 hypothetical protein IW146_006364 [Coemansia sp. RSA 922]
MSLDPQSVPFLRSCERCRQKKRKCSGDKPACAWCTRHSIPCRYRRTTRFKKQLEGYPGQLISALEVPVLLSSSRPESWSQAMAPLTSESQSWPTPQLPTQVPQIEAQSSANPLSAGDFARLFSVDMVPESSALPPDFLQVANSYITPFSATTPFAMPEWMARTNTDASMLANLGDLANSDQASSLQDWLSLGATDFQKEGIGELIQGLLGDEPTFPFGADLSSSGIDSLLLSLSDSSGPNTSASLDLTQGFVPVSDATVSGTTPATSNTIDHAGGSGTQQLNAASNTSAQESSALASMAEPDVPPILKTYVSAIPGKVSPEAVYRIMRETFKAPRTGMVSLNLELVWFMLHKGVLPRIAFYGHLSSTIRCSVVANLNIRSMVPSNIDESCYELALNEVPVVKDSAAIWGAIGLCMLARYEFQSLRYKEMAEHADMAMDVIHRIVYAGHRYPWHDVSAGDKESFGFQYLIAIHWKVFLWKLLSLMLIHHNMAFKAGLEGLPNYSSKTFDLYTMDTPYDVDLMDLVPPNSWLGASTGPRPNIRFRGPSDPEFMRLRPEGSPCFNRVATSGSYIQQLLVIFARVLDEQDQVRQGQIGFDKLLKGLWAFKERMRVWRYSLPKELVVDNSMVAGYLDAIRAESPASPDDIDLRAARLKEAIVLLLTYHSFIIRANRFVMKAMLGEPLDMPPPDVSTAAFNIRDLYDSTASPQAVTESLGDMNLAFHGCRSQSLESGNALCNIIQAAYACKFNFYTLGSMVVFSICDLLVINTSSVKHRDANIAWRAKSKLSNVFNILRLLRHWAPALNMFVAGFKALSDPDLCIDEPRNPVTLQRDGMGPGMLSLKAPSVGSDDEGDSNSDDMAGLLHHRRRKVTGPLQVLNATNDDRADAFASNAKGKSVSAPAPGYVKRDETLSYHAAEPIPEFANPFPPTHVVSLIIKDLGLSLAEFLAPAYPILLLRLIPTRNLDPGQLSSI